MFLSHRIERGENREELTYYAKQQCGFRIAFYKSGLFGFWDPDREEGLFWARELDRACKVGFHDRSECASEIVLRGGLYKQDPAQIPAKQGKVGYPHLRIIKPSQEAKWIRLIVRFTPTESWEMKLRSTEAKGLARGLRFWFSTAG